MRSWREWKGFGRFSAESLKDVPLENKHLRVPPRVALEIDTKADTGKFTAATDYVYEKTDDLLEFGAEKVVWIFTSSKKILVATRSEKWITTDWSEPVSIIEDIAINVRDMLEKTEA